MKRYPSRLIPLLCIAGWAILLLYCVLFQLVAVRLHPKLLMDAGTSGIEGFLNSPLGRFREFMKPVWLNNGPIVIGLLIISAVLTSTWFFLSHAEKKT